jgi:putative flippase GtrA
MNSILLRIADAWHRRTVLAKLFSFASIGVVNVAVDVSVFTLSFQFLHLPLIASNIVAWLIAVTGSYAMNTKITFGRETGGALSIGRYLRFAASGIFGVIVATTVLVLLSHYTNAGCQTGIDHRRVWREFFHISLYCFSRSQECPRGNFNVIGAAIQSFRCRHRHVLH